MSELKNVAQVKERIKRDYLSQIDNGELDKDKSTSVSFLKKRLEIIKNNSRLKRKKVEEQRYTYTYDRIGRFKHYHSLL